MRTGKILYLPFRKTEAVRHEIAEGIQEYEEEKIREKFPQNHRPWDSNWGGPCPFENIPEEPGYKDKFKPALIDRLAPYIWIIGGLGFCLLVGWLIEGLLGVR